MPRVYYDRVTFDELAKVSIEDYLINMRDTLVKAERSVKYLNQAFVGMKAIDTTTEGIRNYISDRMNQG